MIRFNWHNNNNLWTAKSTCGNFTAKIEPWENDKYIWTVEDRSSIKTNYTYTIEEAKRTISTIANLKYSIL